MKPQQQLRARTRTTLHAGGNPWKLPPPRNAGPAIFNHEFLQYRSFQGPGSFPSLLEAKAEPRAPLHPPALLLAKPHLSSLLPPISNWEGLGLRQLFPKATLGTSERHQDQHNVFGRCHPQAGPETMGGCSAEASEAGGQRNSPGCCCCSSSKRRLSRGTHWFPVRQVTPRAGMRARCGTQLAGKAGVLQPAASLWAHFDASLSCPGKSDQRNFSPPRVFPWRESGEKEFYILAGKLSMRQSGSCRATQPTLCHPVSAQHLLGGD